MTGSLEGYRRKHQRSKLLHLKHSDVRVALLYIDFRLNDQVVEVDFTLAEMETAFIGQDTVLLKSQVLQHDLVLLALVSKVNDHVGLKWMVHECEHVQNRKQDEHCANHSKEVCIIFNALRVPLNDSLRLWEIAPSILE
jgi:hypothetical protein